MRDSKSRLCEENKCMCFVQTGMRILLRGEAIALDPIIKANNPLKSIFLNESRTKYSIKLGLINENVTALGMIVIQNYLYKQQHVYYSIVNSQCIIYANPSNDCVSLNHNHGIYLNETYLKASIKTVIYAFYTLMMSSEDALQMRWYLIGLKLLWCWLKNIVHLF